MEVPPNVLSDADGDDDDDDDGDDDDDNDNDNAAVRELYCYGGDDGIA